MCFFGIMIKLNITREGNVDITTTMSFQLLYVKSFISWKKNKDYNILMKGLGKIKVVLL